MQVERSILSGSLKLPPSKSQSLRALIFSHFAEARIEGLPDSTDVAAAKRCLPILGKGGTLDVGNSGILFRFLAAIASLDGKRYQLTGDDSVRARPMGDLFQALRQLGVSSDGLSLQGPYRGGAATLSGHDSQPVSALLIAAAFAPNPTELIVTHPGEIPWVRLTLSWLDRFNIAYTNDSFRRYSIQGNSRIAPFSYRVPADLSAMAFPLVAALVTGSTLTIENADLDDPQGDKRLLEILCEMGARIEGTTVYPSELKGIDVDINDCIDTINALAVAACFASGKTRIRGAKVAREKECDRIACLSLELGKMGARIQQHEDGLTIHPSPLKGAEVASHGDHRMAMALAVAGMGAAGKTVIADTACIAKTFPKFKETLQQVGAKIA